ncbi:hypothetical protein OsI_00420 [Oryza sativa Indica Group]|uniref:Very-long-chain (3R)-3-hydroxyacyl-CoA dehydratase n=1 Tax=Oryza sativa subsp. indica TaxID=39946 RepID=B8ADB4_ORYSI|nr:hypothetical protein OsI_00420 [Oryza sativa Indica Group]
MASRLRLPREMRSGPGQIAFLQWLCLAQSGPVHQSRMIWARDSPTPYWTKRLRPLNQPSMKWSFLPLGQRLEAACSDDKSHWSRPSMVVTRYSFHGMKESFGFTPSWLFWLRYSTFIVCFPVGMVCEVVLIYIALPFMEMKAQQYQASEKSDKWSFSFNYFYANLFFMASFATVYPVLFRYLIALRKKALAKAKPHNY